MAVRKYHDGWVSSRRRSLIAAALLLLAVSAGPAHAQSTDRDRPTPFASSELRGTSPAAKTMYYYSFNAGPGELKVTLDYTSHDTARGAGIELFDVDAKQIGERVGFNYLNSGENYRDVKRFQLKSKQTVIMRLTLEPKLTYLVRLEGAVALGTGGTAMGSGGGIVLGAGGSAVQDDLTGTWKGDDGATYFIRQVGNEVWWMGRGQGFSNVFYGRIPQASPDKISGRWADLPVGNARNHGSLNLTIASPRRIVVTGEPQNFSGREFTRQ